MISRRYITIALSLVALVLPALAGAQVAKQVVVTKSYVPEVAEAVKRPIEPNMVDTVKMRPEIEYSISPKAYDTSLATHSFKPATVTYWEFNRPKNFYIKAGAGYPLNTVGDLYASVHKKRVGYLVAYLNHQGDYAKLPNYADVRTDAMQMQNRVGVAGGLYCGARILEADVNYNSEMFHRYAGDGSEVDIEDVAFKLRFGDNFTDLSRINFALTFTGDYFNDKAGWLAENQQRLQEAHAGVNARLARAIKDHTFELAAGYDGRWGFWDLDDYADNTAYLGLKYGFKRKFVDLKFGAYYCYDRVQQRDKASHYFLPQVKVRFNISRRDMITPYVELVSALESNSYHSLVMSNPYMQLVSRQLKMPNTVNYDLRLGIDGRLAKDKLSYRVYAGMLFVENNIYWYSFDHMYMRPVDARRNIYSINLDLNYKPISKLAISASLHAYSFTNFASITLGEQKVELEGGRSPFEANLKVRYDFGKVAVAAWSDFYSKASWSSVERIDNELAAESSNLQVESFVTPFMSDVNIDVEWKVAKQCTLFLEGRNLANSKIYRWAWYREMGIHFTVGARVSF